MRTLFNCVWNMLGVFALLEALVHLTAAAIILVFRAIGFIFGEHLCILAITIIVLIISKKVMEKVMSRINQHSLHLTRPENVYQVINSYIASSDEVALATVNEESVVSFRDRVDQWEKRTQSSP
ncbi:hypothetical protein Ciccas_002103 [Cichlidogyrus casuarinus]|uniref:Uncharacterized protein n=1 Tax=Cichlidogyrus casuarinus TaxID=1844966 RepID=A0ABD2QI69_9PLAT